MVLQGKSAPANACVCLPTGSTLSRNHFHVDDIPVLDLDAYHKQRKRIIADAPYP
jgi:hypothetical protein